MAPPEILSIVFAFLDQPTLQACLRVSRHWYTCSRPILWRTIQLAPPRFLSLVCGLHDSDSDNHVQTTTATTTNNDNNILLQDDARQDFLESCHCIRSLILSPTKNTTTLQWTATPLETSSLTVQAPGLTNLSHLAIRWYPICPMGYELTTLLLYRFMGTILTQNPGIRELEWNTGNVVSIPKFVEQVLKRASKDMKKLTIVGDVGVQGSDGVLGYLIKANENRQQREQQRGKQANNDNEDKSEINTHDNAAGGFDDDDNVDDGCCQLEELVLQDAFLSPHFHARSGLNLTWLLTFPGELPIRSLSLIDYETDRYSDYPHTLPDETIDPSNGSLLAILSKCPHLVELRVTFNIHTNTPPTYKFLTDIESNPHFTTIQGTQGLIAERHDFVERMYQSCPKLQQIEFGLFYQFDPSHWNTMMSLYANQLTSLSVWGNANSFLPSNFFTLMGPPPPLLPPTIPRLVGSDVHHPRRLTRLNINGLEQLHDCAWIVFYHLPDLQEFRARSVSLQAIALIRPEGWICKGLEVLEISIAVPKTAYVTGPTPWHWCTHEEQWTWSLCCLETPTKKPLTTEGDGRCGNNLGILGGTGKRKREHLDELEQQPDGSRKKVKGDKVWPKKRKEELSISNPFCQQQQILVCEALGRLTKLRELTIEGPMEPAANVTAHGCPFGGLELTLETGLDRLAPLQQNLEKLTVWQLDERLAGKREMEWIAHHWVHYNNPRWLEQHPFVDTTSTSDNQGYNKDIHSAACSQPPPNHSPLDLPVPSPKFKELIGISEGHGVGKEVRDMSKNIDWLQDQCPQLRVHRIPLSSSSKPNAQDHS